MHKIEKRADGTTRVYTVFEDESLTQQQYKDDCDINNIVRKYASGQDLTHVIRAGGQYADFSQITDLQDMIATVRYAEEAFSKLPAELRARFANDPSQLLTFIQDSKNYDEALSLGLVNKRVEKVNDDETKTTTKNTPPKNKQKTTTTTVVEDV